MTKTIEEGIELNRIYNEDCLEGMRRIPDKSVDMILADLPYGTTQNKWDSVIPLEPLWEQYERIIKDDGAIVLTAQTPFDKVLGTSKLRLLKYEWIWIKNRGTGHLNARKMPMKSHENILVFYKKPPTYNPQMRKGKAYTRPTGKVGSSNYGRQTPLTKTYIGGRYPLTHLEFDVVGKTVHPTQKPVALFEYLIRTYTDVGETVLDNVMGSGTTAVAAINTGRNFIGFELEEEYVDIANKRIEEAKEAKQTKGSD